MLLTLPELNAKMDLPYNTLSIRLKKLYYLKTNKTVGIQPAVLSIKNIKVVIEDGKVKVNIKDIKTKNFFETVKTEQWKSLLKLSYYR